MSMQEYEYEPIPGLPEELPDGEYVVWQGAPEWQALARRVFHTRSLFIYFAALIVIHLVFQLMNQEPWQEVLLSVSWNITLSAIALGLLAGAAKLYARSTLYTFTNRRLVVRSGVALPMMVNIPWENVKSAGLRVCGDDTGDILICPKNDRQFYYALLWPYVRPWRFTYVQPLLRGIADPQAVATRLAEVIREEREEATTLRPSPVAADSDQEEDFNEQPIPAS